MFISKYLLVSWKIIPLKHNCEHNNLILCFQGLIGSVRLNQKLHTYWAGLKTLALSAKDAYEHPIIKKQPKIVMEKKRFHLKVCGLPSFLSNKPNQNDMFIPGFFNAESTMDVYFLADKEFYIQSQPQFFTFKLPDKLQPYGLYV